MSVIVKPQQNYLNSVSRQLPQNGGKFAEISTNSCRCRGFQNYKYVQPKIVASFAPRRPFRHPEQPFANETIYKKSYLPVPMQKTEPIIARGSLQPGTGKISSDTIQKMSYPGWNSVEPTGLILPRNHALTGDGPMQDITTQKHDYVPKPYSKTNEIRPPQNLTTSKKHLEDRTINRLSYLPHNISEPVKPILPAHMIPKNIGMIENNTTQKLSYLPWELQKKEILPWAVKYPYIKPTIKMEHNTIHNNSYLNTNINARRAPIIPLGDENILCAGTRFETETIYRKSYLETNGEKPLPIKPSNHITLSTQKMENNTIQKMSFPGWQCIKPAAPIFPYNHALLGQGPMQDITTQKHDYVPKPYSKPGQIMPGNSLCTSAQPLENKTINKLSFLPPCNVNRIGPILPTHMLGKPDGKIENNTTQKLSYLPWEPQQKEFLPWAAKSPYSAPSQKIESNTIYHLSYEAPGEFVPDNHTCGTNNCYCTHAGQCNQNLIAVN